MLQNYFKLALRNLIRNPVFSGINIMGLATAIACCVLLIIYVRHELGYDRFHRLADRIFRVTMEFGPPETVKHVSVTGTRALPEFRRAFPEIESGVRMFTDGATVKYGDRIFNEEEFAYADPAFFSLFSFKLLDGNPARALSQPDNVILTQSTARKYFGEQDVIGKVLTVDNEKDFVITGVVEDCPTNSQIKFDFLASFSSLEVSKTEEWWDASYYTYLMLHSPEDAPELEAKILHYMKTNFPENGFQTFHLEPLRSVHLYSKVEGGFEPAGDYRYPYIFSGIALLILVIACSNYMNLATAKAAERAKEVSLRKVMGAVRKQLIGQFLGESVVIVAAALFVSLILAQLLLPMFNVLSGKALSFSAILSPIPLLGFASLVVIVGLVGGGYPAIVLSRFNPAGVLKGSFKTSQPGVLLRRALIVFQFIISVSLIISTITIREQLSFIQNKKLGFTTTHIVALSMDDLIREKEDVFRAEFSANPDILGVTTASRTPVEVHSTMSIQHEGRSLLVNQIRADKYFISTLGIRLIAGNDFTESDEKAGRTPGPEAKPSIIVNESGAKALGWTAEESIGKMIEFRGQQVQIKGVVEDFHFTSMHRPITPLVIFVGEYRTRMIVRLSGDHVAETMEFIKAKWSALAPHYPLEFEFLDEQFNKLYSAETRTADIFYAFAVLAIGLACLGLMGLVAFTAQQRTKEIGIRKVLGATAAGITILISRNFLKPVIWAMAVAVPLTYFSMSAWLSEFAYRVELSWSVFIYGGATALLIALVTISFQSVKAALANPVESLRNE